MSVSQAVIGSENLLEQAVSVTASSERPGFEARNAWDGVTTTYWQAQGGGLQALTASFTQPVSADYLGLFAHTLGSTGTKMVLQVSMDNVNWTSCFDPFAPASDACLLQRFPRRTGKFWRFILGITSTPPFIGVLSFGQALIPYRGMPVGFIPPAEALSALIIPSLTEGGALAGRSVIPLGSETTLLINYVPMDWVRTTWRPFIARAQGQGFFFSWNHATYPDECVYAMAKPPIPAPQMNEFKLYHLSLPILCLPGVRP